MFRYKLHKFRFLIITVFVAVIILALFQWSLHSFPFGQGRPIIPTPPPVNQSNIIPTTTVDINTPGSIHLFLNFTYNIANPATIAKYYDFIWGAQPEHVASLRAGNPNLLLSYYVPFYRDDGTFENYDLGSQQGLDYWHSFHSDWILYKCDRSTPAYYGDNPRMPLDFTNSAVIDWQLQTYAIPASEHGYGAIAADNVDLINTYGACGVYRNGKWVQLFSGQSDDPRWRDGILKWLTQMQNALHQLAHPLLLIPNVGFGSTSPSSSFVQQLTSHVDAIADEGGFTNYGDGYLTGTDWSQKVQYIQKVQKLGKSYYLVGEVPSITSAEMQWSLGTYLLCNEGHIAIFISHPQDYGNDTRYPTYNISIGEPAGDMYKAQGIYWRDYSSGLVAVNPSGENSYTVTTSSGKYVDINGKSASRRFTLSPHSAMILLNP